jgi:hypothetical protein
MLTYLILTPSPLLFHCKVSHTIQEGFDRWFHQLPSEHKKQHHLFGWLLASTFRPGLCERDSVWNVSLLLFRSSFHQISFILFTFLFLIIIHKNSHFTTYALSRRPFPFHLWFQVLFGLLFAWISDSFPTLSDNSQQANTGAQLHQNISRAHHFGQSRTTPANFHSQSFRTDDFSPSRVFISSDQQK